MYIIPVGSSQQSRKESIIKKKESIIVISVLHLRKLRLTQGNVQGHSTSK